MATTEQVIRMNGGLGEASYANNSSLPRKVFLKAKPVLEESIRKIYSSKLPSCLKVADLGCSSGPNAFQALSVILDSVDIARRSFNLDPPSFQFFLNDLFGNDFNSTFESIPEFSQRLKQEKGEKFVPCFINGNPGSFYGRLFPSNSIDFFHSSYSLHWLSQGPKDPLNKGTIINFQAYLKQFQQGFKVFLRSRSEELVAGGGMALLFIGRYDDTFETITQTQLIYSVLKDMVSQKLIEEAKLKSFSMPYYGPTAEEVRETIKEEGSFSVLRMESIRTSWDGSSLDEGGNECFADDDEKGKFIAKYMRSVFEPVLKAHFGEGIMDQFFLRFKNKAVQLIGKLEYPALAISLIKKA